MTLRPFTDDDIALLHRPNPGWGARRNHIPRQERHNAADVANQLSNRMYVYERASGELYWVSKTIRQKGETYRKKKRIPHNVLNAKHHEQEAMIVAQAGRF